MRRRLLTPARHGYSTQTVDLDNPILAQYVKTQDRTPRLCEEVCGVRIGTERISSVQRDLLERTKRQPSGAPASRAFLTLVEDTDIAEDREDVHPDWLELFENERQSLQNSVPP